MINKQIKWFSILSLIFTLIGCGSSRDSAPVIRKDVSQIPNAVPRNEPRSKYGNPASYVVFGQRYYTMKSSVGYEKTGIASWYGTKFHGKRTSSGETYDMYAMTAAHKTLPLPTYLEVTNVDNGRRVIVKVNDRGPFHDDRLIDLSYTAATKLGIIGKGTGHVKLRAITPGYEYKEKRAPEKTIERVVTPAPVDAQNAGFYLQLGAFSSQYSAQQLQKKLQVHTEHNVTINSVVKPENLVLYRVRIGPLVSALESDALAVKLTDLGFDEAKLVIE